MPQDEGQLGRIVDVAGGVLLDAHKRALLPDAEQRYLSSLERDAHVFREVMDPHEHETSHREALRRTARGAVEDWLDGARGG